MEASGPDLKKLKPDDPTQNVPLPSSTSAIGPVLAGVHNSGYPLRSRQQPPNPAAGIVAGKEFFSLSAGSRSKPCLKFFSTCGCPHGEACHYSHYLPGGLPAPSLSGFGAFGAGNLLGGLGLASFGSPSLIASDPTSKLGALKSRICNRYNTPEGCRFGDKCHFAHGEKELQKSNEAISLSELERISLMHYSNNPSASSSQAVGGAVTGSITPVVGESNGRPDGSMILQHHEPAPPGIAAATFGASSTAKTSINANLAGAIIGKGGVNAKQICRLTGAKLSIREHESDPNLRNVEFEGSIDQIKLASLMVQELLMHKDILHPKSTWLGSHNYKTKMCENYAKGTCTFGDRCHFAHGDTELHNTSLRT